MKKLITSMIFFMNLTNALLAGPFQKAANKIFQTTTKTTTRKVLTAYAATSLTCGTTILARKAPFETNTQAFTEGLYMPTWILFNLIAYPPYCAYKSLTGSEFATPGNAQTISDHANALNDYKNNQ